jgi:membrane fusion protein (multidrug efflux system)
MVLENQYEMAKANLGLAQARLDLAENNLAEIEVKALADGQISRRHAEPGQVVAPGQKIFTITAASPIWVEANFEEDDVAALKPGDAASIKVDAYPGRVFSGHVAGVLPASLSQFSLLSAGASSGNFIKVTQRVPVRLILDAHDLPPLYPGLNVEVRVRIGTAPSPPQAK